MTITNAQFGLSMEDHGELEADVEAALRSHFNLHTDWGFQLNRGGMWTGTQASMSAHFFLNKTISVPLNGR